MSFVAAFPVGAAYIPGDAVILRVFEERYLLMMKHVLESTRQFVSVLIAAGSEVGGEDQRFNTGVLVEVDHVEPSDFGVMVYAHAAHAVTITNWNNEFIYPRAQVVQHHVDATLSESEEVKKSLRDIASQIDSLFTLMDSHNIAHPHVPGGAESVLFFGDEDSNSEAVLWSLLRLLPCGPLARFEVLALTSLTSRASRIVEEITHLREIITFRFGP